MSEEQLGPETLGPLCRALQQMEGWMRGDKKRGRMQHIEALKHISDQKVSSNKIQKKRIG